MTVLRGRTADQKPKLGPRQVKLARQMYDELGDDGKRRYTVAAIAAEFGVTRPTIYRAWSPRDERAQHRRPQQSSCGMTGQHTFSRVTRAYEGLPGHMYAHAPGCIVEREQSRPDSSHQEADCADRADP